MTTCACPCCSVQVGLWWTFSNTVTEVVSQSTFATICALKHRTTVTCSTAWMTAVARIVRDEIVLAIYTVSCAEPFSNQVSCGWTRQTLVSRIVLAGYAGWVAQFTSHRRSITKITIRACLVARSIGQHEESGCACQTIVNRRSVTCETACSTSSASSRIKLVAIRSADGVTRFIHLQELCRRTCRAIVGSIIVAFQTSCVANEAVRHCEVEVVVRGTAGYARCVVQEVGFCSQTRRAVAVVWSFAGGTIGEACHALVDQLIHEIGCGRTIFVAETICCV